MTLDIVDNQLPNSSPLTDRTCPTKKQSSIKNLGELENSSDKGTEDISNTIDGLILVLAFTPAQFQDFLSLFACASRHQVEKIEVFKIQVPLMPVAPIEPVLEPRHKPPPAEQITGHITQSANAQTLAEGETPEQWESRQAQHKKRSQKRLGHLLRRRFETAGQNLIDCTEDKSRKPARQIVHQRVVEGAEGHNGTFQQNNQTICSGGLSPIHECGRDRLAAGGPKHMAGKMRGSPLSRETIRCEFRNLVN